jgi:3-methyladenine DNA glycosylase/8-oxoguanine DNA glycosylase
MNFLKYGSAETSYLSKKDIKLGQLISKIGYIKREVYDDLFDSLIGYIATQQISNKAAVTVRAKIYDKFKIITAKKLDNATDEEIQSVGISMKKVQYMRNLSRAVLSGELEMETLKDFSDDEVKSKLTSIKGIGNWTAEMFLIFSLKRMDVVSYKDLAIRRGMMSLYGLERLEKKTFERYRENYSPYGTVASLYLWSLSKEI